MSRGRRHREDLGSVQGVVCCRWQERLKMESALIEEMMIGYEVAKGS